MQSTLRPYATAGAAIVSAGLIAVIPMAAAFLQVAVAAAAPEGDTGSDVGFTIGNLTFEDPVAVPSFGGEPTPGYESLSPLFSNAPLLALGTDKPLGLLTEGFQQFTLEDGSGTTLGTVKTNVNVQDLLGIDTAQFTVSSTDPASGLTNSQAAELPADGTVYSITNVGGGFANVYEADPNADGTAASTITDTLVTPFGNIDVPTSFDAIAPLDPAAPLVALGNTSGNADLSDNAFTIDDTTFDPGSDFSNPLLFTVASFAPLLKFGAGSLILAPAAPDVPASPTQSMAAYSGGADDGTVHTSLFDSDLLGLDSTQFTVQSLTPTAAAIQSVLASDLDFSNADFTAQDLANVLAIPSVRGFFLPFGTGDITSSDVFNALTTNGNGSINLAGSGITDGDIASALNTVSVADLPAIGTVYSVTDLGSGYENVYEAVPGADGGAATITDTLVTPFGNFNVPTSYDATAPLDPATPLAAVAATSGNASLSDNAFTLDGTTFDPGSGGFTGLTQTFGIAPLLEIAGVNPFGSPTIVQDGVEVYDSGGTDLGSVDLGENLSNILGIHTTQFTVTSVDAATDLTASETAELPAQGTVYSITDLGSFTNVYEAIPNADGTAASSITDTLITPFGNIDLSSVFNMFDAIAPLDAGDAADGVSTAGSAAAEGFDLFDPSTWF